MQEKKKFLKKTLPAKRNKKPIPNKRVHAHKIIIVGVLHSRAALTLNDLDPREPAPARSVFSTHYSLVDVRTSKRKHGAANSVRVSVTLGHSVQGSTAAATAATAVPHGHISRAIRTAATAVPSEPVAGTVAAGAASPRSPAAGRGTQGLAVTATRTVPGHIPGYRAAAAGPPAEDSRAVERRADAARADRTDAARAGRPRATDATGRGTARHPAGTPPQVAVVWWCR